MSSILRPHHGMCLQFYEGRGYSQEFTDHMGRVLQEFRQDPGRRIVLKPQTDLVCGHCPHNRAGCCDTQEKTDRYDREVMKACGFFEGEEMSVAEAIGRIKAQVIETGLRSRICADCSWNEICSAKSPEDLWN